MNTTRLAHLAILAIFTFSQAACLKTRTQLRQEQGAEGEEAQQQQAGPKGSQYQIEEIKAELVRVGGKVEEIDHHQQTANLVVMKESVGKLELQVQDLEKNQVLILAELKALKDTATEKKAAETESASIKAQPKDALTRGFAALDAKKFDEATSIFQKIVSAKPSAKENAEAHYGLGQAQYLQKDYKKAIVTLSKVQEVSAKSPRVAASLYLIGRSFEKLNMKKEAAGFYAELAERHPKSAEAKKVKSKTKSAE